MTRQEFDIACLLELLQRDESDELVLQLVSFLYRTPLVAGSPCQALGSPVEGAILAR
jgi:hypothetical protein